MRIKTMVLVTVSMLLVIGCKPGIPSKYLQPDDMVDILYDYHLAEGMSQSQVDKDSVAMRAYMASILKQHGVSSAEFYSSMVYYTRHTKLLDDVYNRLADRLDKEAVAHGGSTSGLDEGMVSGSDTANVWNQGSAFVLSPYAATNVMSFEIKADTSYHAGDRFILDFDAQFLYQDGMRDASVVLAVTYDNDSIEYVNNSLSNSSHYRLQVNNSGRLGIKSVKGFWLLTSDRSQPSASATTLKLLVVSHVRLVRMHTKEPEEKDTGEKTVIGTDSVNDDIKARPINSGEEPPLPRKPMAPDADMQRRVQLDLKQR